MSPIVLTRSGPVLSASAAEHAALLREWQQRHCLLLPRFLHPDLYADIAGDVERGVFADFVHEQSGHEAKMEDNAAVWLLDFLMNSPVLLEKVSALTGRTVSWFHGRVYRLTPGTDEGHAWHKDYELGRQLGVSINLTPEPFSGGTLELRDTASRAALAAVTNTGRGDCVIFRLGDDIQHRVLPVTGTVQRVAYAGWFYSGPTLHERLARRLDHRGR
ncbi:MAG: 2OG-Fe(II) oxygenase [Vicinamibacterales bacterium]